MTPTTPSGWDSMQLLPARWCMAMTAGRQHELAQIALEVVDALDFHRRGLMARAIAEATRRAPARTAPAPQRLGRTAGATTPTRSSTGQRTEAVQDCGSRGRLRSAAGSARQRPPANRSRAPAPPGRQSAPGCPSVQLAALTGRRAELQRATTSPRSCRPSAVSSSAVRSGPAPRPRIDGMGVEGGGLLWVETSG